MEGFTVDDALLRLLAEQTQEACALFDLRGRVRWANTSAQRMIGAEPGAPLSIDDFPAPGHLAEMRTNFMTAIAGRAAEFETVLRQSDGATIEVGGSFFPLRDERGETVAVGGMARDISILRLTERKLLENQQRFRSLFEYHPDAVALLDESGAMSNVNVALVAISGYEPEELIHRPLSLLLPNAGAIATSQATELQTTLVRKDGHRVDVLVNTVPVYIDDNVVGAYLVAKDNSEEVIAQAGLRSLYLVAASAGRRPWEQLEAAMTLGLEFFRMENVVLVEREPDSDAFLVRFASNGQTVKTGDRVPRTETFIARAFDGGDVLAIADSSRAAWTREIALRRGQVRSYIGVPIDVFGERWGAIGFSSSRARPGGFSDSEKELLRLLGALCGGILERARHETKLDSLAYFDSLTGLPNRVLLHDRISQALLAAKRHTRSFALHFLDLDGFKRINDRYGHPAGDELLRNVAHRLTLAVRESDTVARLGGDEFVVLQPTIVEAAETIALADRITGAFREPFIIGETEEQISTSIGIAVYPRDATSVDDLIERADKALYVAKDEGRNRYVSAFSLSSV